MRPVEIRRLINSPKPKDKQKLTKNQKALEKFVRETLYSTWIWEPYFEAITDAIAYIRDEAALSKIALESIWDKHRRAAIKNPFLKDEEVLTKIALKPGSGSYNELNSKHSKENWVNKFLAMKKINDDELLARIAENGNNDGMQALNGMSYDEVLKYFALKCDSSSLQVAAIEGINDQSILLEILDKPQYDSVNIAAIKKLKNQDRLMRIVLNNRKPKDRSHRKYCVEAIRNITDEDFLIYMAQSSECYYFRKKAIENPNLKDEETIIDFAKNDDSHKVRIAALERLNNHELFIDIAFHDGEFKVREYAAGRINSKNVLRELVENDRGIGAQRLNEIEKLSRYEQLQIIKNG